MTFIDLVKELDIVENGEFNNKFNLNQAKIIISILKMFKLDSTFLIKYPKMYSHFV